MAQGKPLNSKLFIEGIEVPFVGATITHTVNQASIAYIDLVPQEEIQHIKPRTLVQLFVRQFQESAQEKVSGATRFPYVLAWEGEVFGYTFGRNPNSRSFSVSAIDFSGYWDNALTYFFNLEQALNQGVELLSSASQDTKSATASNISIHTTSQVQASFYQVIFKKVFDDNPNADLLDAFVEMYRKVSGINEFFNDAEERLRITDRFVIHSSKKIRELIEQKEALDYFYQIPNTFSGFTSLRTVIQELLGMIFHDFVTIPFPSRVSSDIKKPLPSTDGAKRTIGSFAFKPNLFMMPPPLCNVFFPDEYSSFNYSRNFFEEPTRLIYQPELPGMWSDTTKLYMEQTYAPESFRFFMTKKPEEPYPQNLIYNPVAGTWKPDGDLKVSSETAKLVYNQKEGVTGSDRSDLKPEEKKAFSDVTNNTTRQFQWLTNEEKIKGIYFAKEGMVPFSSSFRKALDEMPDAKNAFNKRVAEYLFYKKRFRGRQVQITSHLKMSVVPGFPVLILDDQDPGMSVVAYCNSVTHRIYATEGGHTNVTLSYARTVGEQSATSDFGGASLLIPPWFEESIFGKVDNPPDSKAAKEDVSKLGKTHVSPDGLKTFYNTLLGGETRSVSHGSSPLTTFFSGERTLFGSTAKLASEYLERKKFGSSGVQEFIAVMTNRPYVKMEDAFSFLSAKTTSKADAKYMVFDSDIFSRRGTRNEDAITQKKRVIQYYINSLKTKRGFRG